MRIDEHELACRVCDVEGGKVNLSVAQVKEVLHKSLVILANEYKLSEALELVERHQLDPEDYDKDKD